MSKLAVCLVLAGLVALGVGVSLLFRYGKEKHVRMIKEWLLYAVTIAEKEFGSGTGVIKLRFVYNLFLEKFNVVGKFVSFELFCIWVDEALDLMRQLIDKNEKVKKLVE